MCGGATPVHDMRRINVSDIESTHQLPSGLFIGTSGWSYDDWRGRFYPDRLSRKEWLAWYPTRFRSAEINGSFYRTPKIESVEGWRAETPGEFRFSWKASKFITHWKRLSAGSESSLELMETRLAALGPKCGPVLFQLPERFHADPARLSDFLAMLAPKRRYVFEFRHVSWYETLFMSCYQSIMLRFAFPIIMMHPLRGLLRRVMFMFAGMVLLGNTMAGILHGHLRGGHRNWNIGLVQKKRSMSISTTTRRLLRQKMLIA